MRIPVIFLLMLFRVGSVAQELAYYLPKDIGYDPSIPTPEKIIGHKVGEWHVTHDRLVQYMRAIDAVSDRAVLREMGFTYE